MIHTITASGAEFAASLSTAQREFILTETCDAIRKGRKPRTQYARFHLADLLRLHMNDNSPSLVLADALDLPPGATVKEAVRSIAGRAGIRLDKKPPTLDDVIAEQERLTADIQKRRAAS